MAENSGLGSGEVDWHSDNSYVETPPAGSMLHALEIPPGDGGATAFSNQYLAYEALPEALAERLQGLYQRHDSSRNSAGVLRPAARLPATPEEVEGPVHPLLRRHPVTGRTALYLGRRRLWPSNYVLGLAEAESRALLDELWRHAGEARFAWSHQWRAGETLIWDNRSVMHHRTASDASQRRVLHRTQIKGEAVTAPWD